MVRWFEKRRRLGLLAAVVAGIIAVGLWLQASWRGPTPPTFQGKPFDYWLSDLATNVAKYSEGEYGIWLTQFKASPEGQSNGALQALRGMGPQAVPVLAGKLRRNFYESVYVSAAPHLPKLVVRRLPQPKRTLFIRQLSMLLLSLSDLPLTDAIPDLIPVLRDRDMLLRRTAARLLGGIGVPAEKAIPSLAALVADPKSGAGDCASEALAQMEAQAASQHLPLPKLKACWAALVRGIAQPRQPLMRPTGDDDQVIRAALSGTFWKFGYDDYVVLPLLVRALNNTDSKLRLGAVRALSSIGQPVQAALPVVRRAQADLDPLVRLACVQAIPKMSTDPPTVVSAMITALSDAEPAVLQSALEAIMKLGPQAKGTVQALLPLLRARQTEIRGQACQALAALHGDAEQVVPRLTEMLEDTDSWVLQRAIEALGQYGPQAKPALPRLLELRKSATSAERFYLDKALRRIDPQME